MISTDELIEFNNDFLAKSIKHTIDTMLESGAHKVFIHVITAMPTEGEERLPFSVPLDYARDGTIILNMNPEAHSDLIIKSGALYMNARFNRKQESLVFALSRISQVVAFKGNEQIATVYYTPYVAIKPNSMQDQPKKPILSLVH